MLKKLFTVAAVIAALAGVALYADDAPKKKYKIGAAVYGLKNEYAQLWVKALKEHPAVKSGLVELTIFDGQYKHINQANQFDTMITQKYDGAIYVPIDSNAGASVVDKAAAAGLPVVGSNSPSSSDKYVSYIGSNDVLGGQMCAEAVIKAMGGKGNVVIFEGPVGQTGAIQRSEGLDKVLKEHPDIKVLERKTANWSRTEAMGLMQNWITKHPNDIQGVIPENDEMALGAVAAMKQADLDVSKIPVAGIDGVSDAVRAVEKGAMILSIRQDSKTQSQGALDILLRKLIGPEYKPLSDVWAIYPDMPWGDGTAKLYPVPWTPITKANAADYLKK